MGGKLIRTNVGDRFVVEEMLRRGLISAASSRAT